MHHPGRVVRVDPGEAAAGGDQSGRVLSPGPAEAESSWDRERPAIEVDGEMDMEVIYRQVVPDARHTVDHLPFMALCASSLIDRRLPRNIDLEIRHLPLDDGPGLLDQPA